MNQSNKALRESVAELVKKSNHTYSGTPMHTMAGWGFMDVSSDIIALVTNHIKGRMPKKFSNAAMTTNETNAYGAGWNHCLDEVSQVLNEL